MRAHLVDGQRDGAASEMVEDPVQLPPDRDVRNGVPGPQSCTSYAS